MGKRDLIFITSYPEKNGTHTAKTVGVASYTKKLVVEMARTTNRKISVFAEKFENNETTYTEDKIFVNRLWKRSILASLFNTYLKALLRSEQIIFVSFEINMFGGYFHAAVSIVFAMLLRIIGKKVVVILHQAPRDLNGVSGQRGVRAVIDRLLIRTMYVLLKLASTKIVVFEEYLRMVVGGKKVEFIPHYVDADLTTVDSKQAKNRLGWKQDKKYAMVLGYIAPYKGILELIDRWNSEELGCELVVAGGINPNHSKREDIVEYVRLVNERAKMKGIVVTGFVGEDLLPAYFAAADVVVIPYKAMFSSSGPLSMAWSYHKPIIMSEELLPYLESSDIAQTLAESGLNKEAVFCDFSPASIKKKIASIDRVVSGKYQSWGVRMQAGRNLAVVAQKYIDLAEKLERT